MKGCVPLYVEGISKLNIRLFDLIQRSLKGFKKQKTFIVAATMFTLKPLPIGWDTPA